MGGKKGERRRERQENKTLELRHGWLKRMEKREKLGKGKQSRKTIEHKGREKVTSVRKRKEEREGKNKESNEKHWEGRPEKAKMK